MLNRYLFVIIVFMGFASGFLSSCATIPSRMEVYTQRFLKAHDLYNNEQYDLALSTINSAISLNTTISEGYFLRGKIQFMRSDFRRSVQDLSTALNLGLRNLNMRGDAFLWRGVARIRLDNDRAHANGCRDLIVATEYGVAEAYELLDSLCSNINKK